jgi:hypothetical protein
MIDADNMGKILESIVHCLFLATGLQKKERQKKRKREKIRRKTDKESN